MINLKKIISKIDTVYSEKVKAKDEHIKKQYTSVDLNDIPHYKITAPISAARECLFNFFSEYGKPKSSTYNSVEIRQAKLNNLDEETIDRLYEKGRIFNKKIKKMRQDIWMQKFETYEDYLKELSSYVKEHGAFINCNETACLVQYLLKKEGIKSQNIYMYTVNNDGNRVNKAEHVFCVIGLDKNADIQDISTWGDSAAICDPWANMAMNAKEGIKFYQKLFNIDKEKYTLHFEPIEELFPKTK